MIIHEYVIFFIVLSAYILQLYAASYTYYFACNKIVNCGNRRLGRVPVVTAMRTEKSLVPPPLARLLSSLQVHPPLPPGVPSVGGRLCSSPPGPRWI